jgi:hypothetical protein
MSATAVVTESDDQIRRPPPLLLSASSAYAESSLMLECKRYPISSAVDKDPIVAISVSAHGQVWSMTHICGERRSLRKSAAMALSK